MLRRTHQACYRKSNQKTQLKHLKELSLLDFREASQRPRVAAADKDPRRLCGRDRVPARHRQLHVLCKVSEVVDGLLDGVELEARDGKVGIWVRVAVVAVLEEDCRAGLLLCDEPRDGCVGQEAFVT